MCNKLLFKFNLNKGSNFTKFGIILRPYYEISLVVIN